MVTFPSPVWDLTPDTISLWTPLGPGTSRLVTATRRVAQVQEKKTKSVISVFPSMKRKKGMKK